MKGAVDAHGLGSAPLRVGQLGERDFVAYGGVVDDDIEAPETFGDGGDHGIHVGAPRDVGDDEQALAPARRYLAHRGLPLVAASAHVDGDLRPRVGILGACASANRDQHDRRQQARTAQRAVHCAEVYTRAIAEQPAAPARSKHGVGY